MPSLRMLAEKDWLSLSVAGSCSSYEEQAEKSKEKSKDITSHDSCLSSKGKEKCNSEDGSSISTSIGFQEVGKQRLSDSSRKREISSSEIITAESTDKIARSSPSYEAGGSSNTGKSFLPFKKPKVLEKEEEELCPHKKVNHAPEEKTIYIRPYKKWPSKGNPTLKGWLETAFRMGVTRPQWYLRKTVTETDANPDQHRFQLTKANIRNSPPPLQALARQVENAQVAVKVLDREGRMYDMTFKYLACSHTYRFMGADYTKFLTDTKLKPKQIMDIWGLPREGNQEDEYWFAFINTTHQRMEGIEGEGEGEGGNVAELPFLSNWKVKL